MQRSQPASTSSSKSNTISVGQALLILMDKFKDNKTASFELKKLYLSGAKDKAYKGNLESWLKDPALQEYNIARDAHTIDEDPTRRYFETHLAFWTLTYSLRELPLKDLTWYRDILFKAMPGPLQNKARVVLFNTYEDLPPACKADDMLCQYNSSINKLKATGYFPHCDEDPRARAKMRILMQISYLSILNAQVYAYVVPLRIYGKGFFAQESRGRIEKDNQFEVKSQHFGLMKSYMPLPRFDIAFANEAASYQRPADRHTFDESASWCIDNFNRLVHPFSCSISGTILGNLNVLAYHRQNQDVMTASGSNPLQRNKYVFSKGSMFASYLQAFMSLMVFNSGGHSFHELTYVLSIPEIQQVFSAIPAFKEFTMENLFLIANQKAFDQAISAAIKYNKQILKRSRMLEEINASSPSLRSDQVGTSGFSLFSRQASTSGSMVDVELDEKNLQDVTCDANATCTASTLRQSN